MAKVASGTRSDNQQAAEYIKGEIDKVLDKSEEVCKTASKTAFVGIVPVALTGVATGLRYLKVPEFICKGIESLGGSSLDGCAETVAGRCAKGTNQCAKACLHASVDSTCKSKGTFYDWVVSWIK